MTISTQPVYSTLPELKRVLGATQKMVKFSEAIRNLKAASANTGDGVLASVVMGDIYSGNEDFTITFTSGTAFGLVISTPDEGSRDVGTGDTSVDFISTNKEVEIVVAKWSGSPLSGDKFTWRTISDFSNENAKKYLSEAERMIDLRLRMHLNGKLDPTANSVEGLLFTNQIPPFLDIATSRLAAYLMFVDRLSDSISDEDGNVNKWKDISDGIIEMIGKRIGKTNIGPRWMTRKPIFSSNALDVVDAAISYLDNTYGIGIDQIENKLRAFESNAIREPV